MGSFSFSLNGGYLIQKDGLLTHYLNLERERETGRLGKSEIERALSVSKRYQTLARCRVSFLLKRTERDIKTLSFG